MCYGTARTMYRTRAYAPYTRTLTTRVRPFLLLLPSLSLSFPSRLLSLSLSFHVDLSSSVSLQSLISLPPPFLCVDIRTARSNITIRSQTNSLAMPERLPFTGRTVVSPV